MLRSSLPVLLIALAGCQTHDGYSTIEPEDAGRADARSDAGDAGRNDDAGDATSASGTRLAVSGAQLLVTGPALGLQLTEANIAEDADVIAVHQEFYGIPWSAFETNTPPPAEWAALMDRLAAQAARDRKPVFLSVNMLNGTRERLAEYAAGLGTGPLPASAAAAVLVYGQLAAGIAIAIGLLTRPVALAAAVLAVAALVMTESGGVFVMWIAPLATLAGAAFLVLRGAGRLSLDGLRSGR